MRVWQGLTVSCDGGKIGRTWRQTLVATRAMAEQLARAMVDAHRKKEEAWQKDSRNPHKQPIKEGWNTFEWCEVEGIKGWAEWCRMTFIYFNEVEVLEEEKDVDV